MILLLFAVIVSSETNLEAQTFVVDRMPVSDFKIVQSKIYPNPSAGSTNLAIEELPKGKVVVEVIDLSGNIVYEKNIYHENDGMFYTNIDAENIPEGIYKVRVVHENLVLIRKWTKI